MKNETLKEEETLLQTTAEKIAAEAGKTAVEPIEYELPAGQISGQN
jgi:hypothetical protein